MMASSTTDSPGDLQKQKEDAHQQAQLRTLIRYTSFGSAIVCPILLLIPPRRLNIFAVANIFGAGFGLNYSLKEVTGMSLGQRLAMRMSKLSGAELPEKARLVKERIRVEKEMRALEKQSGAGKVDVSSASEEKKGVLAQVEGLKGRREERVEVEDGKKTGIPAAVEKIWLGGEGEDWKTKRDRREKEALAEGKGYYDLIADQIWEVWNWGKDKAEDIKEKDEKVVKEGKDGKK
jgi:hypothetical protein